MMFLICHLLLGVNSAIILVLSYSGQLVSSGFMGTCSWVDEPLNMCVARGE